LNSDEGDEQNNPTRKAETMTHSINQLAAMTDAEVFELIAAFAESIGIATQFAYEEATGGDAKGKRDLRTMARKLEALADDIC
jgi:hypothetical protein